MLPVPLFGGLTYFVGRVLIADHAHKVQIDYTFEPGDIKWRRHYVLLVGGTIIIVQ